VLVLAVAGLAGPTGATAAVSRPPVRAAFYYPWFPEGWSQQGQRPFTSYTPTRGFYGADLAVVRAQIADMQYARISVGIASWFGRGTTTDSHWPALARAAAGTGFGWAPYYEREGSADPAPQQIANDLHYLRSTFGPAALGALHLRRKRMVVFVYNADDLSTARGCSTVSRWSQARRLLRAQHRERVYIDLKVFPGYRSCRGRGRIDGWHQYAPAAAVQDFSSAPRDGAYAVSPGYWKSGTPYGVAPFLRRDRARWRQNVATMSASRAEWQLVTTYNEWGEGTAIESASGCRVSAPPGTYCDWSGGGARSDFLTDLRNSPPA
jgi:hypothetical protein